MAAKEALTNKVIEKDSLVEDLRTLGVRPGDLLNIKISLKSIGYVQGGANTVIEALLDAIGPEGTIVSDSFIYMYKLPLSEKNAQKVSDRFTPSYAGAIANAMIKHPKAFRSLHPIQKFVAIGAQAEGLMNNHTPDSPAYDVLRIMAETGGRNLKIGTDEKVVGVGTTHVAINALGFKHHRPRTGVNYRNEKGEIVTFECNWAGGCGTGFNNLLPLYREGGAIISEGRVGQADSKITDMGKTLALEIETLPRNPAIILCKDPACEDCRLNWDFSDGSKLSVWFHKTLKKRIPSFYQRVRKQVTQLLRADLLRG